MPDIAHIKRELERAVRTAKQPHYGYNDTEIDHLWEAIDIVIDVIKSMENQHEKN